MGHCFLDILYIIYMLFLIKHIRSNLNNINEKKISVADPDPFGSGPFFTPGSVLWHGSESGLIKNLPKIIDKISNYKTLIIFYRK